MTDQPSYPIEAVRLWVWSGMHTEAELREMLADAALDEDEFADASVAKAMSEMVDEKRLAEASWPPLTDCDRLDRAFSYLNGRGVCALQNAGYTKQDGYSDVAEVVGSALPGRFHGFCFYHQQDMERAIDGHPLFLAFDDLDQDDIKGVAVGHEVVAAMQAQGFEIDWDGTIENRMSIPKIRWQKRSFSTPVNKQVADRPWWKFRL